MSRVWHSSLSTFSAALTVYFARCCLGPDQALRASEIWVLIVRGSRRSSRPAGRACTLATLNR